jgi:hypothetical protein
MNKSAHRSNMPSLRIRKRIYYCLAVPCCVFWIPLSLLGVIMIAGIFGLLSIGALLRCIAALPVTDRIARYYYSAAIAVGMLLMAAFIAKAIADDVYLYSAVAGVGLMAVGAMVLAELYVSRA